MKDQLINLQYTTIKDPLPDFIYEGLKEFSANSNSYKPQPKELLEKISVKHNLNLESLYLVAGADEGIQTFARIYGRNAYVFTPTYTVYKDVRTFGGELTEIYSIKNKNFEIEVEHLKDASLVYLANPNNPSGFTPKEKVIDLVLKNPEAIVVIDEAYGDFAPELSVMDQVSEFQNLAVLRSFSKGYGMAGNRIGYIVSNSPVIAKISDFTQWANVSYLSVGAAIVALEHEDYFQKMRDDVTNRRDHFMSFLKQENYDFLPSKINAVVIQFTNKSDGTNFFNYLGKNNIIASHGNGSSNIGLDESFVRIAVGTTEQMKIVQNIILKYRK